MKIPGTIKRRGGVLWYDVSVAPGKRFRVSLRTNDRRIAEERAAEFFAHACELVRPAITTVSEFATSRWLKEYVAQRRNARGVKLAEQRLRDWIFPELGDLTFAEVDEPRVRIVRARAAKLSLQSQVHVLADLRCLLRYAARCGYPAQPAATANVFPRIAESAPLRYTERELGVILKRCSPDEAFVVRLAAGTGLRRTELAGLTWGRFSELPYPHLVLHRTKSGRVREVPLMPAVATLLRSRRRKAGDNAPIVGLSPAGLSTMAARLGLRLHRLRHTFACRWLEAGGSVESLQAILGHSTVRLTERYGRVSAQAAGREAKRIAAQFMAQTRVTR